MAELTFTVQDGADPSIKKVAFTGEMDEAAVEALRPQLEPLLNDGAMKTLVFDLQNLSFINSKGIGYIVSVHTHLAKDGRKLVLAAAQEAVMDVINLVGLTSIIPYADTAE